MLLLVVAVLLEEVEGSGQPSTYKILSLVDQTNPAGPHFIGNNYISTSSAQWTPFTSFPLHRVIIHIYGLDKEIGFQIKYQTIRITPTSTSNVRWRIRVVGVFGAVGVGVVGMGV